MLTPSISGRAEADLVNQYQWYLENAGEQIAERFLSAFDLLLERLSRNPEIGRQRQFRDPALKGIRSVALGRQFAVHLVFYRVDDNDLSVYRVMHGARNLAQRLLEPPQDLGSEQD